MATRHQTHLGAAVLILGITLALLPEGTQAHPASEERTRLIAQCLPATTRAEVEDWCHDHQLTLGARRTASHGLEVIELLPGHNSEAMIEEGMACGLFEYVEPDYPLTASLVPNDRALIGGQTWGLLNVGQRRGLEDADIDAPEAWDLRTRADDVIVAVIDSGIRYTHEDLAANMWRNPGEIPNNNRDDDQNGVVDDRFGYNAVDFSGNPWDDDGHGTSVSGVIGAVGDNNLGTAGVAWQVQLMALKFLTNTGSGSTFDAIECIHYAIDHGAHVINASWGGNGRSRALERAIRRARDSGVIFVTAAGNDGVDIDVSPDYPASYTLSNVVTVGASTRTDRPSRISNFGMRTVDLFAPGTEIYTSSSRSDSSYTFSSGTSLAAPFVSGALALMISAAPDLTISELTDHLLASVDPLPLLQDLSVSGGRLNVATALTRILPPGTTRPSRMTFVRTDDTSGTIILNTRPNQPFLLESSSDLESWRPLRRIETDDEGHYQSSALPLDGAQLFYRIIPLN